MSDLNNNLETAKLQKTKSYIEKLLLLRRFLIGIIIFLPCFFITAITLEPFLSFGAWYGIIMLSNISFLVLLLVYYVKFSALKNVKDLKKRGIDFFLKGIDLSSPSFEVSKIYCGENAFLCKKSYALIPYGDVAWIYSAGGQYGEHIIRLKDGKRLLVMINEADLGRIVSSCIIKINPNYISGRGAKNKKRYFELCPDAYAANKKAKSITGCILATFGLFILVMRYIQQTIDSSAITVSCIFILIGIALLLFGKKYINTKAALEEFVDKNINSPKTNLFFRVITVTNIVSIIGMVTCGPLYIEVPFYVFAALYVISVIPFFLSLFLGGGFFGNPTYHFNLPSKELDDVSYILDVHTEYSYPLFGYHFLLSGGYGWEYIKDSVDYLMETDFKKVVLIKTNTGIGETDLTKAFIANGNTCKGLPELEQESLKLYIVGYSKCLKQNIRIEWSNQTKVISIVSKMCNEEIFVRYAETLIRRTFGTNDALKLAKPAPAPTPVTFSGTEIHIKSNVFFRMVKKNPSCTSYEFTSVIPLTEKEPVITLYDDEVKTREFRLQTENDEDFSGKYFHISVRLGFLGNTAVPISQIDGFISDTKEERQMTYDDIGYRMEGYFLISGGEDANALYEATRGRDLESKGLKYRGYTTPSNVRLIGICADCGKSFTFHSYAFYMISHDVAYSDDGMDCLEIYSQNTDSDNWILETEGKTFRYYNSFNCPHCKTPYIDYKKHPEMKSFGVSGCVHIGRYHYSEK